MWGEVGVSEEEQLDARQAKQVLRRAGKMLRPYRREVLVAGMMIVLWTFATLAGPYFVKFGIDQGIAKGNALDEVVVTNTIPLSDAARGCGKIRQLTVAPLIAETIQRIAKGESVMSLFSDQVNLF